MGTASLPPPLIDIYHRPFHALECPCRTRVVGGEESEGARRATEVSVQLCVDDVLV